jgi:hypothetical protein
MSKMTVIIKRNATYEAGMFGVSIHNEPGGAANVQPINSEVDLRAKLLQFGVTESHADDIIHRLKSGHESVSISVDPHS